MLLFRSVKRAVDAGVWSGDAGDAQGHRFDPSKVVAGAVHVEQSLGQAHRAATGRAQSNQCQRVHLEQADVLGQFILTLVEFVVGHLHALDIDVELFSRQQTLLAGQVAKLEKADFRVAQLVLQGALGLFGNVEGELEALRIQPFHFALHPGIERLFVFFHCLLCASSSFRNCSISSACFICCRWFFNSSSAMASRICAARSCLKT